MVENPAHIADIAKGLFWDLFRVTRLAMGTFWIALTKTGAFPVLPPVETWPWRVLAAPGAMIVVHYILYAIIRWTRLATHRTTADRLIWFSVATGSTIAWTYMLYPILPGSTSLKTLGSDAVPGFDSYLVQNLVSSYMLSWVVMCLYYWATGVTSADGMTSPGFYVRKLVPAVAVIMFHFALVPALSPIHSGSPILQDRFALLGRQLLTSWLMRYAILDSMIDLLFVLRVHHSFRLLFIGVWYVVFWPLYETVDLHVQQTVLGTVPCICVLSLGVYVLYFDLSPFGRQED